MGFDPERYIYYCPKCGDTWYSDGEPCAVCGHEMLESPHEYGLSEKDFEDLWVNDPQNRPIWEERKQRLYDDVISESDIFDIKLYNRRDYILEKKEQHYHELMQDNSYQVECPYCKSNNVRRISGLSKAGAVAFFGIFGLGKASKEWHCNQCDSDF